MLASVSVSACSGVASSVTVGALIAWPRASGCNRLSGREHQHVLQNGAGHIAIASRRTAGHQHVDVHARQHEAGDAGDVVDAHGNRAHAHGNGRREAQVRCPWPARRPSRIGSSSRMLEITGRSSTSSTLEYAPLGNASAGILTILTSAGLTHRANAQGPGGHHDVAEIGDFLLPGAPQRATSSDRTRSTPPARTPG